MTWSDSQKYHAVLWSLLAIGYVLYGIMAYVLIDFDVYSESSFFKVEVNETAPYEDNPYILGVPIKKKSHFYGMCVFFFINAFLGVVNGTVISSLWGLMLFTEDERTVDRLEAEFNNKFGVMAVFALYDLLRGVRAFFNILGVYSNAIFFVFTVGGSTIGSLTTKWFYLDDDGRHYLRATLKVVVQEKKKEIERMKAEEETQTAL